MRSRERIARLKRMKPLPLSPSLEEAFEAIENFDARHPSARATTYGGIKMAEARTNRVTLAQDGAVTFEVLGGFRSGDEKLCWVTKFGLFSTHHYSLWCWVSQAHKMKMFELLFF
jgi:hypothetical protein